MIKYVIIPLLAIMVSSQSHVGLPSWEAVESSQACSMTDCTSASTTERSTLYDPRCIYDQSVSAGCGARGQQCCRYCGFGEFSGVECACNKPLSPPVKLEQTQNPEGSDALSSASVDKSSSPPSRADCKDSMKTAKQQSFPSLKQTLNFPTVSIERNAHDNTATFTYFVSSPTPQIKSAEDGSPIGVDAVPQPVDLFAFNATTTSTDAPKRAFDRLLLGLCGCTQRRVRNVEFLHAFTSSKAYTVLPEREGWAPFTPLPLLRNGEEEDSAMPDLNGVDFQIASLPINGQVTSAAFKITLSEPVDVTNVYSAFFRSFTADDGTSNDDITHIVMDGPKCQSPQAKSTEASDVDSSRIPEKDFFLSQSSAGN